MLRCALLLLTLLLPCALPAANLRLVGDSWPPFVDSRLPGNGLAVELVTTALKRAGFDSSFQQVPWSRALYGVRSGDYDIALSAWYEARPQPLRAVFPRLPEQPHSPAATHRGGVSSFPA